MQYLVTRREDFRDRRVVIAGGGDSAVDWALSLAPVAASVSVVHRRPKFRAAPESARRLQELATAGEIELVVPYQLAGLEGDGKLSGVRVATLDGEERLLEADVLLPFYGLATSLGPIAGWGLELAKGQIAVDPASCQSSRPGIFAIGDVIGGAMLAHKAEHEGVICIEKIAGLDPHPLDKGQVPGCTYCHPQIASVGLTEDAARKAGLDIKVGRFPFIANGKAVALGEADGLGQDRVRRQDRRAARRAYGRRRSDRDDPGLRRRQDAGDDRSRADADGVPASDNQRINA